MNDLSVPDDETDPLRLIQELRAENATLRAKLGAIPPRMRDGWQAPIGHITPEMIAAHAREGKA